MKTVCFFGIYDPEYSRNRVLMEGFRENGFEVVECRVSPRAGRIAKYFLLVKEYEKISRIRFTHVIVAFPGHTVVWIARFMFGKKIVFDAFTSMYNSEVEDRKHHSRFSPRALYYWLLDKTSCLIADKVLLDTNAHINYFCQKFNLSPSKFIRVLVGTSPTIFHPEGAQPHSKFTVHFHGSYIPLQGIDHIVEAALLLHDLPIIFRFIGRGQEYTRISTIIKSRNISNIELYDKVSPADLASFIHYSDVCLGIFGTTSKTNLVIPNKVYEAAACGKTVITADTDAIKEIFTDRVNIRLVKAGRGEEIAKAIRECYSDKAKCEALGHNALEVVESECTPKIIVERLLTHLQ